MTSEQSGKNYVQGCKQHIAQKYQDGDGHDVSKQTGPVEVRTDGEYLFHDTSWDRMITTAYPAIESRKIRVVSRTRPATLIT